MTQEIIGSDKANGVDLKNGHDLELDSIYGSIRPMSEQIKCDKLNGDILNGDKENNSNGLNQDTVIDHDAFVYKTMNGGVVRSVHPPGKGTTYKVSSLHRAVPFHTKVLIFVKDCCHFVTCYFLITHHIYNSLNNFSFINLTKA